MNTRDISKFGHRERQEAAELLKLYGSRNDESSLEGGVNVEFNPNSGHVFLVDEDYNVAMEFEGKLVDWVYCPDCGFEDYKPEFRCNAVKKCCLTFYRERYGNV